MEEEEQECIRRATVVERKSVRQIARESGRSRKTVKRVVDGKVRKQEQGALREKPLVYEPYRQRVEELWEENRHLPSKQRYTTAKIYEIIRSEGYSGCESRIRQELRKRKGLPQEMYLPLSFEPGEDAQCDWVRRVGADEIPV